MSTRFADRAVASLLGMALGFLIGYIASTLAILIFVPIFGSMEDTPGGWIAVYPISIFAVALVGGVIGWWRGDAW